MKGTELGGLVGVLSFLWTVLVREPVEALASRLRARRSRRLIASCFEEVYGKPEPHPDDEPF